MTPKSDKFHGEGTFNIQHKTYGPTLQLLDWPGPEGPVSKKRRFPKMGTVTQAIRQTSLICEKPKVRIMVFKIQFYLINFFRAPFLLKCHPDLPKYYKFNYRKNANFKIRHFLISGCLISGSLINQAPARSKLGGSLINQAAAWSKSGSCLIDQDPDSWEV